MLFWAMFVIGRPDYAPVVGQVGGIAATAGLQQGDTILKVGDRATPTWSEVQLALIPAALDHADIELQLRRADGTEVTRELPLSELPAGFNERRAIEAIGLAPRHLLVAPLVGRVAPDTPAWGVLAEGDRISAVDGHPVQAWGDIGPLVPRPGERGGKGMVEVERDGDRLALEVAPTRHNTEDGGAAYCGPGSRAARPHKP